MRYAWQGVWRGALAVAATTCIGCQPHGGNYQTSTTDCLGQDAIVTAQTNSAGTPNWEAGASRQSACVGYMPRASLDQLFQH